MNHPVLLGLRHHYEPVNTTSTINKEPQWNKNITQTKNNPVTKMADFFNKYKNNKTTGTTELWGNITGLTNPNKINKSFPYNNLYNNIGNKLTTITVNMANTETSTNKTGSNPKKTQLDQGKPTTS